MTMAPFFTLSPCTSYCLLSSASHQFFLFAAWLVGFFAWNSSLLAGGTTTPRRSLWAWGVFTALSLSAYATGWHYGLPFQGRSQMQVWLALSMLLCVASAVLLVQARRKPNFFRALAAHTTLWFWVTTVAVPWLGEMP